MACYYVECVNIPMPAFNYGLIDGGNYLTMKNNIVAKPILTIPDTAPGISQYRENPYSCLYYYYSKNRFMIIRHYRSVNSLYYLNSALTTQWIQSDTCIKVTESTALAYPVRDTWQIQRASHDTAPETKAMPQVFHDGEEAVLNERPVWPWMNMFNIILYLKREPWYIWDIFIYCMWTMPTEYVA